MSDAYNLGNYIIGKRTSKPEVGGGRGVKGKQHNSREKGGNNVEDNSPPFLD